MTLVSVILQDAYRETNILPLGKAWTANQTAEALRLLNNIFYAIAGNEQGENFQDFPLGNYGRQSVERIDPPFATYFSNPPINRRLLALNDAAMTVYFPVQPCDGSRMAIQDPFSRLAAFPVTVDGNGRTIEGAATQNLNTNGLDRIWFYRADKADWVRVTDKAEADEMPFPRDFDDMFMIMLALRLNPRHGRELSAESAEALKRGKQAFVNRYLQSSPLAINDDISWPFLSIQGYDNGGFVYGSTASFNRGDWR